MAAEPYFVTPGDKLTAGWMNAVVGAVKRRNNVTGRGVQWGAGSTDGNIDCFFGELIDIDDDTDATKGIRGGTVFCGNKNFKVEYLKVETTASNKYLISLKLDGITFVTDDDQTFILPGIKTTTGTPEYEKTTWSETANYPDNINPDTPTATGTIYVPLGILTEMPAVSGDPIFEGIACGNITIDQCSGVLGSDRT